MICCSCSCLRRKRGNGEGGGRTSASSAAPSPYPHPRFRQHLGAPIYGPRHPPMHCLDVVVDANMCFALTSQPRSFCVSQGQPVTWSDAGTGFTSPPGGISQASRSVLSYHYYEVSREGVQCMSGCVSGCHTADVFFFFVAVVVVVLSTDVLAIDASDPAHHPRPNTCTRLCLNPNPILNPTGGVNHM